MNNLEWHIDNRYGSFYLGTPAFWLITTQSVDFTKEGLRLSHEWTNGEYGFYARKGKVMVGENYDL